ncbi:hypothetical protein NM688_g6708 [Phlebia brevispora]|uniref:Uncharacterized protein n=1 Tax=Phlebia brevispora TaxID=194682 RepID=A0ACC1SDA2_9APHY|nr:hypothetical protein NM688_g6708 [Phlebia brevispora]
MLVTAAHCARLPRRWRRRSRRIPNTLEQRAIHDLLNVKGNPVISYGPPGRSAVTGRIATVFGSTGFLARYLIAKLAKSGTQVIVPYRDEDTKRHLKVMGDLGQIVPMEWDLRRPDQIEECIRHSDTVYNLVGRDYETRNYKFGDVNVEGPELIAKVAADVGVPRLFHVSHLNASKTSTSQFYKTKAEGEEKVLAAFPGATIVRPAAMYGYEDKFLNNMAMYPIWWKLNHMKTTVRPVHSFRANLREPPWSVNLDARIPARPRVVCPLTTPPTPAPVVPKRIARLITELSNRYIWWPTLSPDEVERRFINDVDVPGDWDKVGVVPTEIEDNAITYLRRYRSADNYTRPVVLPHSREDPMLGSDRSWEACAMERAGKRTALQLWLSQSFIPLFPAAHQAERDFM